MNIKTLGLKAGEHVFVLERQDQVATVSKAQDGSYRLRGPAAVFGIENNNGRIYEEEEYLPHLDYLNKKIARRKLLGELDHPEGFDISMGNVSHLIEKLEVDEATRTLNIQILLLDTPAGKIAKALIDAGVPLSISSRAAGQVMENKKVVIKKIFTYDLVSDPGFEEAELYRINENAASGLKKITRKSVVNDLKKIEGSGKYVDVYKVNENSTAFIKAIEDVNMNDNTKFVTIEEMEKYSNLVKEQMSAIQNATKGGNSAELDGKIALLEGQISHLGKFANYLAILLDKSIRHGNHMAEGVNKAIKYADYLGQGLDKSIMHTNHLAEGLNKSILFQDYLAENVDKSLRYSDSIAEGVNGVIDETMKMNEKISRGIQYTESIAENVDNLIRYSEMLAESIESVDAKKLNENVKTRKFSPAKRVHTTLNENNSSDKRNILLKVKDYSSLLENTDTIIGQVNKQKTTQVNDQRKAQAVTLLSDARRQEFTSLDETKQQKVYDSLLESGFSTEKEVVAAMKVVINENVEVPKYIVQMPEQYKALWETCNEDVKAKIVASSATWNLQTAYQIKSFWNSRDFGTNVGPIRLTESVKVDVTKTKAPLGYSKDVVAMVAAKMKRI